MIETSASTRRVRRLSTIAIALAGALVCWLLAVPLLGVELIVDQGVGPQPVRPVLIAAAPILSGLTGWGLLALLERLFRTGGRIAWRVIAAVVLLISLASPITMGLSAATVGWLLAMHLVVGAIVIIGLSIWAPAATRQRTGTAPVPRTAA